MWPADKKVNLLSARRSSWSQGRKLLHLFGASSWSNSKFPPGICTNFRLLAQIRHVENKPPAGAFLTGRKYKQSHQRWGNISCPLPPFPVTNTAKLRGGFVTFSSGCCWILTPSFRRSCRLRIVCGPDSEERIFRPLIQTPWRRFYRCISVPESRADVYLLHTPVMYRTSCRCVFLLSLLKQPFCVCVCQTLCWHLCVYE